MGLVDKVQEREFEQEHILRQKEKYLATDVTERVRYDRGYAAKLSLIEAFLSAEARNGPILDLGANTGGESEYLVSSGFPMVATDINEIALALSRKRALKFGRPTPLYYGADAHRLPFADETFGDIVAFEVLHHFENLPAVLDELYRVMRPGGRLLAYEPYAFNPYRRLAELRFVLLGSIEKSFTKRGLSNSIEDAGFSAVEIRRNVLPPSEWKKRHATRFRAFLKTLYYEVGRRLLPMFGNLVAEARKPGSREAMEDAHGFAAGRLQCPITGSPLVRTDGGYEAVAGDRRVSYPVVDQIPVLIAEDAAEEQLGQ